MLSGTTTIATLSILLLLLVYLLAVGFTPLTKYQWDSLSVGLSAEEESNLKADAAIVLGHAMTPDGQMSEIFNDRLHKGMDLLKKGHVQYVVISGYIKQGTVQALTMAKWLQEHSPLTGQAQIHFHDGSLQRLDELNSNRIIFENSSNNTWQNALCSLRIAEQRRWSQVVVVTSSYHQLRSSLVFQQQQQEVEEARRHHHLSAHGGVHAPVDTPHSGSMSHEPMEVLMARAPEQEYVERWRGQKDFARELAAVALYVWRGRISPTVAVKAMLPLSVPYLVFLISGAIAAHQLLRLHNSKTNSCCQQHKSNQAEQTISYPRRDS